MRNDFLFFCPETFQWYMKDFKNKLVDGVNRETIVMTFRLVKAKFIQNTQRDVGWASSDARNYDDKFYVLEWIRNFFYWLMFQRYNLI